MGVSISRLSFSYLTLFPLYLLLLSVIPEPLVVPELPGCVWEAVQQRALQLAGAALVTYISYKVGFGYFN